MKFIENCIVFLANNEKCDRNVDGQQQNLHECDFVQSVVHNNHNAIMHPIRCYNSTSKFFFLRPEAADVVFLGVVFQLCHIILTIYAVCVIKL